MEIEKHALHTLTKRRAGDQLRCSLSPVLLSLDRLGWSLQPASATDEEPRATERMQ